MLIIILQSFELLLRKHLQAGGAGEVDTPERSIFNVVVSRLVLRRVEAIADGGGGSEEVLPSPSSTLVPHVVLPSSLLCLLALQWERQRYPE